MSFIISRIITSFLHNNSSHFIAKRTFCIRASSAQSAKVFTQTGSVSNRPPKYRFGFLKVAANITAFVMIGALISKYTVKLFEIEGLSEEDDDDDDD